jgi:hypothetical protein
MFRHVLVIAVILLASTTTLEANQHQIVCSKRADVVKYLSNKFKEKPISMGLANNGGIVEIFSNQTGASWTIIITMPNGISCILSAGENWEKIHLSETTDPSQKVFQE